MLESTLYNTESVGGFLYLSIDLNAHVHKCKFKYGIAALGGAIYVSGDTDLLITESEFIENSATNYGGALYLSNFR